MPRVTLPQNPAVDVNSDSNDVEPETQLEPVAAVDESNAERIIFLSAWLKETSGFEPEVLGTFSFVARQNGWHADTPSGWKNKLTRWINGAAE